MEITLEQVERLREKADVSYEEARAVLEETGGSLLDALILLERRGKVRPDCGGSARYSTRTGGAGGEPGDGAQERPEGNSGEESRFFRLNLTAEEGGVRHFFQTLLRRSLENSLEVWRREELVVSIPLLISILLLILAFWTCLPLLVLGLALGCRYRLAGPDFDRSSAGAAVNRAASAVGDTVEHMKDQTQQYFHENHRDKK